MTRLAGFLLLLLATTPLAAQPLEHCQASLISEDTALVPGRTHSVGLRLEMEEGWHVYWRNSGDTGLPLEVVVTGLPKGLSVGALQWPAPERYLHEGAEMVDFVHHSPLTIILPVTVAQDAKLGSKLTIKVRVSWLVCKEMCIPGSGEPRLTLPVAAGATRRPEHQADFQRTRARLPSPPPDDLHLSWDDTTLVIRTPAKRLLAFAYLPEQVPPENSVRDGAVDGGELRLRYPERIRGSTVKVLLGRVRGTTTTYHWLILPAPKPTKSKDTR